MKGKDNIKRLLFFPKRENASLTTHRLVSHTRTEDTIGLNAVAMFSSSQKKVYVCERDFFFEILEMIVCLILIFT